MGQDILVILLLKQKSPLLRFVLILKALQVVFCGLKINYEKQVSISHLSATTQYWDNG
jgi:hypothetical protein